MGAREPSSPPENMGGVGVVALGVVAAAAAIRGRGRVIGETSRVTRYIRTKGGGGIYEARGINDFGYETGKFVPMVGMFPHFAARFKFEAKEISSREIISRYPDVIELNKISDSLIGTGYEPFVRFYPFSKEVVPLLQFLEHWAQREVPISQKGRQHFHDLKVHWIYLGLPKKVIDTSTGRAQTVIDLAHSKTLMKNKFIQAHVAQLIDEMVDRIDDKTDLMSKRVVKLDPNNPDSYESAYQDLCIDMRKLVHVSDGDAIVPQTFGSGKEVIQNLRRRLNHQNVTLTNAQEKELQKIYEKASSLQVLDNEIPGLVEELMHRLKGESNEYGNIPEQKRPGKQILGVQPIGSRPGRGGRLLSIDPVGLAIVAIAGVPLLLETAQAVTDVITRYGFSWNAAVNLGAVILTGLGAKAAGIEALMVGSVREARGGGIFGGRPGKIIAKVPMENPSRNVPFEGNPDAFQGMEYPLGIENDKKENRADGFIKLLGQEGMKELQELQKVKRRAAGANGINFDVEFIPVMEKGRLVKVRVEASQIFGDNKFLFDQPRHYNGELRESKGDTQEADGTVVTSWLGNTQVAYRGKLYPVYHRAIFQLGLFDFYVFNGKRLIPFKRNDLEVVDLPSPSLGGEMRGSLTPHLFFLNDGVFFEMNEAPATYDSSTDESTAYGKLNILRFTVFTHRNKKYFSDENRRQIYPVPEIYKELKISDGRTVYYDGHYFRELPKDETVLIDMPHEKQRLPAKTESKTAMPSSRESQLKFIDGFVVEPTGYGKPPTYNHPIFTGDPDAFVMGVVLGGKILRGPFKLGDLVNEPRTGRSFRLSFDPKRIVSEPYQAWSFDPSEKK